MRRVFVYEHLTGGGMLATDARDIPPSLMLEGAAMVQALAIDFAALAGVEVLLLRDYRLPKWHLPGCRIQRVDALTDQADAFARSSASADWTVVIAPEFDGILVEQCRRAILAGGRLLGPSPEIAELCADKYATAEHLLGYGVSAPPGRLYGPKLELCDDEFPAVIKPRYGAGSQDVTLARTRSELSAALNRDEKRAGTWLIEPFYSGIAASVAVLCGPQEQLALEPCLQVLSDDGRFQYLGGALPLRSDLTKRASSLASRAISTLVEPLGYLGVDLILGKDEDGSQDVVVEINPRLTTSYIGLRAASKGNLAEAMLSIAEGRRREVEFHQHGILFNCAGTVTGAPTETDFELAGT